MRQPALRGGRRNKDLRPSCLAPAWVRIRLLDEPPRTLAMVGVTGYLSGQLDREIRYPRDTAYMRQVVAFEPNTITCFVYPNGVQQPLQRQTFTPALLDTVSVTFRF